MCSSVCLALKTEVLRNEKTFKILGLRNPEELGSRDDIARFGGLIHAQQLRGRNYYDMIMANDERADLQRLWNCLSNA
jgi:hypothetical protein